MDIRHASHPEDVKHFTTERLRQEFICQNLMQPGKISLVYSHYDRFIIGGAVPVSAPLELETYPILRANYFLERRELGIINTGAEGTVTADGQTYTLQNKDCLYLGMGTKSVSFASKNPSEPAHFYLASAPAHTTYPAQFAPLSKAEPTQTGTKANCNERTIYKLIHQNGIQSCQLVMGMTMFSEGSIWNTMPCHVHDRRMEAYFYFDFSPADRVMHFMGEPQETRHLMIGPDEAIISPPWSVHFGVATSRYSFIWAMAGENKDYTDMDVITTADLR